MSSANPNSDGQNHEISVLIVDDHVLISQTLESGLIAEGGFRVESVVDMKSALSEVSLKGPYDVVLLDYQLPGVQGLQGLRQMIEANQKGVVLFSGVAGWSIVERAVAQGASGFIPKTTPLKTLIHALKFVADGENYLPAEYMRRALTPGSSNFGLKPREMQVLAYLCEGLQNKEIGREVGIDEMIVKMDVKSVCRKLGVRNRTEALIEARRHGLC
jgi:two-component system, NarL family, nitrate/nitrite response regulator NarL